MRTVKLTSGKIAIPVIPRKVFITHSKMVSILTDCAYRGEIENFETLSKSSAMAAVRNHLFFYGISISLDFYDSDAIDIIDGWNAMYKKAEEYVISTFPKLPKATPTALKRGD